MAAKETLDGLAETIRFGIEEASLHSIFKEDLEQIWAQDHELPDELKTMMVMNFACFYGFKVEVLGKVTSAMFYAPNKTVAYR